MLLSDLTDTIKVIILFFDLRISVKPITDMFLGDVRQCLCSLFRQESESKRFKLFLGLSKLLIQKTDHKNLEM